MRVALVHDWLTGLRGGERVLDALARHHPDADCYTLLHVPGATTEAIDRLHVRESPLARIPGAARHYRKLLPAFPWAIRRFDLSGYDLVISCSHAVAKSVATGPHTPHLAYCLTPMRYVWDQTDAYLGRGLLRAASWPLAAGLRRFDRRHASESDVTRFVAISSEVARRVRDCYGRSSEIVFPPVDVERIRPNGRPPEDFYLLVGGFVPYKREDLALEAFRGLDRRLVVVGDGPARRTLARSAPPGVEFTGRIPDAELADLFARCKALVYPQKEDFGIAAVEAQAAGRPVIAFGEGGARDTVLPLGRSDSRGPGPTGWLFDRQDPQSLRSAVLAFETHAHHFDPERIRAWAEGFGTERFHREWDEQVAKTLSAADAAAVAESGG